MWPCLNELAENKLLVAFSAAFLTRAYWTLFALPFNHEFYLELSENEPFIIHEEQ